MNPLISRFAGEPALVEPQFQQRFEACLAAVASHERADELMSEHAGSADDFWRGTDEEGSWRAFIRPYNVVDGILQIPVKGVLLHSFPYALGSWATGYEYIWQAFKRGAADFAIGAIKGIALICDTPGGMVAGCFDAVDKMVGLKGETGVPVRAFAHESAYSAGYAIATVADSIAVSRTGGVGSIGVVTGHLNVSGAMEKAGLVFTYIASDPSKVEGNPYEALSPEAKARIQARIDELYGIFVAAVARSRGLEESAIRDDLKAHCYTATQALSNGLADSVGSLEDAMSAFADFLDAPSDNTGEEGMSTQDTSAVEQAAHEQAVAAARADGEKAGAAAATARIGAILGSEEAKGRSELAEHFAFSTDMSADAAIAALAKSPKAAPAAPEGAAPANPLDGAMGNTENPEVGANADKSKTDKQDGSDVLALVRQAGIGGFKQQRKD